MAKKSKTGISKENCNLKPTTFNSSKKSNNSKKSKRNSRKKAKSSKSLDKSRKLKSNIPNAPKAKTVNTKLSERDKKRKEHESKRTEELDFNIIGSGSSGNCVRIENLMFDVGLPYKHIKDELYLVDYIFLTHIHQDHIKPSTFNRIKKEYPDITFIGNHEVAAHYPIDVIVNKNTPITIGTQSILPFEGKHNVLVYGYIFNIRGFDCIYCTDSSDYDNSPSDKKYDYMFLESNHDTKKLYAINRSNMYRKYGYNAFEAGVRHCSTQKCMAFYYEHRKSSESKLIELHKSDRFY